ncbi:hypothetical protein HanXRQr2_Chr12g0530511 [Helianthus annuus]|uniref:Uncharacterized protein n=1 Tax=Helianthus annuus TaxID=4232 RepID=A0A9K3ENA6_HELAN|nr:hypothetical protein HanXRQr2_Chr12g0530511 [Helianthus annuus]KAJ0488629.1 hypothetical protein HanHA300_Chr12g0434911 [Helianthus annuus]KAJ0861842.1 hypothetical protein HanPSC8_Chr12g0511201 [Helianthus annuus]
MIIVGQAYYFILHHFCRSCVRFYDAQPEQSVLDESFSHNLMILLNDGSTRPQSNFESDVSKFADGHKTFPDYGDVKNI